MVRCGGLPLISRDEALELVKKYVKNDKLIKHMLAVEAIMRKLAEHLGENVELWGLTGLLHDLDYELMTLEDSIKRSDELILGGLQL